MNSMEIKVIIYLRLNILVLCDGRKKDLSRFFWLDTGLIGHCRIITRIITNINLYYGCHDDHEIN